jgi:hypothetical protein
MGNASRDFVAASHEILFASSDEILCDACGGAIHAQESADEAPPNGQATYLWARGDETTLEHVPLCASCASVIGMTALARWEIEEEEG